MGDKRLERGQRATVGTEDLRGDKELLTKQRAIERIEGGRAGRGL
jgi:hypothetical protein